MRFNGTYGSHSHKRQRYLCRPKNGDPEHTFTEKLPRQMTHSGDCEICERAYTAHEGPQSPRGYSFSAQNATQTLMRLGEGRSYRSASASIRELAGRKPSKMTPEDEEIYHQRLRNGQFAADWTEVFAPVIFEHYRQELADEVP